MKNLFGSLNSKKVEYLGFILVFAFLLTCFSTSLYSAFGKDDAGTSTANFLKLGAGARSAGMGEAFVGVSDDATAVYWNPGGLSQVKDRSLSIMHAVWFEDIFYDWISYVHPANKIGTFGLGIQYLSYGDIKETDETGLIVSNFNPSNIAATVSYARKIFGISIGINAKYISSKITKTAYALAGDIGIMWKSKKDKISVGLVGQNLGMKMKFVDEEASLPAAIKIGGAYKVRNNWIAALDVSAPLDNEIYISAGSEYNYKINNKMILGLRAGYGTKAKYVGGLNSLTAGIGINYLSYSLDYAFLPLGNLGNTHRISFSVRF